MKVPHRLTTISLFAALAGLIGLAGCASEPAPDFCYANLRAPLDGAVATAEAKLAAGCAYEFDNYYSQLLAIGADRPDQDNRRIFSDHLVRVSDQGTISRRQAQGLYNRYFNVKFVSLAGDYNTCSQTCPVRTQVLGNMRGELLDKELGLMKISGDSASYYRADHLLKESQLVLEATCRACDAGSTR
jgi:hypothetical protein